jgi:hypothetical protein
MKVKMALDVKGAAGNGETTIMYKAGHTYEMKTDLEMQMAGAWLNDGRALKDGIKLEKKAEKAESKVKKVIKKVLSKKKK